MKSWKVTFCDKSGKVIASTTVECAFAHNAPKVAFRQLGEEKSLREIGNRIEVTPNE